MNGRHQTDFSKRQISKGLGGWQRLGIVLAIAWTLGVGAFVWSMWPDLAQMQANAAAALSSASPVDEQHPVPKDLFDFSHDPEVWQRFSVPTVVGHPRGFAAVAHAAIRRRNSRIYESVGVSRIRPQPVAAVTPEEQRLNKSLKYWGAAGAGMASLLFGVAAPHIFSPGFPNWPEVLAAGCAAGTSDGSSGAVRRISTEGWRVWATGEGYDEGVGDRDVRHDCDWVEWSFRL